MASNGVLSKMTPVFPSKTFPNHYTVVTGLFPETHGIVSNTMYDPVFNATFSLGNTAEVTNGRWWGGEPIWVTTVLQGLKSATYFWPGSEAEIKGTRPTYYEIYNRNVNYTTRINQVLAWLDLPLDQRPSFLCCYFELVDDYGHSYGPDSPKIAQAIDEVDGVLGYFLDQLKVRSIQDEVNVILTSDHGMTGLNRSKVILIDNYINMTDVFAVDIGPVVYLIPNEGKLQQIYNQLNGSHPNMTVYFKEDIPEVFTYRNNRRITPIVGIADEGWSVTTTDYFNKNPNAFTGGNHGYDNRLADMQAIFVANGPAFQKGIQLEDFVNLDVYLLLCHALGLEPASNNGTLVTSILA